jgi:acyl-CoA synthetase (AMP-forming)/AMP-acid ligase II
LAALRVGRGDNVALLTPVSVPGLVALLAVLRAGACVVPLPVTATQAQLEAMACDAKAKVVLVERAVEAQWRASAPRLPTEVAIIDTLGEIRGGQPIDVRIRPDDPFNIIYSSGTTGKPKGIVYDHAMRWYQVARAGSPGVNQGGVCIVSTPLYSNTTLAGGLLHTLATGGTLVLMPKFDAGEFLELCTREGVTNATLVPVQCQRLLNYRGLEKHDLSRLTMRMTAAPSTVELKRELAARLPGTVLESYGFTELGAGCVLDLKANPDKLHTVGRPRQSVELKIIDSEGQIVPVGSVGEVVGRAVTMMRGYYGQSELTSKLLWIDSDGREFLRSGDLGRFDEDGFLQLVDRKKDVIISGGFNIYPVDLEAEVATHADVDEVAVIGVPSEQWGESPLALVVLRDGATTSAAQLLDWTNARLGKTQRLVAVEFRERLPRNAIGKLMKGEMRAAYWSNNGQTL